MAEPTRRMFVIGAAGLASMCAVGGIGTALSGKGDILRPPGGQDSARFAALCIKCDRCRSACPEGCITVATLENGILNARTPRMDFHKGFCTFCSKCADVCSTGAISAGFDLNVQKIGCAVIDQDQCLAYNGGGCRKCADACTYGAISWTGSHPVVDASLCNGCGICENACPSNSLRSFSGSRDTRGINIVPLSEVQA